MTIDCQEADVLAAALSVGSLEGDDIDTLQEHLSSCAHCSRVAAEYMEAASRLPLALPPVQPPAGLRRRLMREVYSSAERGVAAPWHGRRRWVSRAWARLPSSRLITVVAAAAVAVVAVLAVRDATAPATPAGEESVALVATAAAAGAHGQLVYTPAAHQGVLSVEGLPAPRVAGSSGVYEVWLIRPDGSATAAAFLTQAPDGSWTAAMRGDMSPFTAVATTAEPMGGSLAPTGPKVVVAYLDELTTGNPSHQASAG